MLVRAAWCALAAGACLAPRPAAAGLIAPLPFTDPATPEVGPPPPADRTPAPDLTHPRADADPVAGGCDRAGWGADTDREPDPARVPAPPAVLLAAVGGLLLALSRWRRPDDIDPAPPLPA